MAKLTVQGYLSSLSNRPQGRAEEDLLQQRFESVSQQAEQVAQASRQPFKSSIATVMGDTLGKGLLRAFGVKDAERQRAVEIDQANKLLQELQKKPMTSKNLMDMAAVLQTQGQTESAMKAIKLATEYDNNVSAQQTTNVQRVNVANQAVAAGYTDIAARVSDQTYTPKEGLAEILQRQQNEKTAAATAAGKKPNVQVKEKEDGTFALINLDTGKQEDAKLTPDAQRVIDEEKITQRRVALANVDNILTTLDEAEALAISPKSGHQLKGFAGAAGPLYGFTSIVPSTDAMNLADKIQTLEANVAFDKLQAMRNASQTGGALGQVSNLEIGLLKSSIASLNPQVGEEPFKQQLDKVRYHYKNVRNAILGKPVEVDYNRPEYQQYIVENNNKTYFQDPITGDTYEIDLD